MKYGWSCGWYAGMIEGKHPLEHTTTNKRGGIHVEAKHAKNMRSLELGRTLELSDNASAAWTWAWATFLTYTLHAREAEERRR